MPPNQTLTNPNPDHLEEHAEEAAQYERYLRDSKSCPKGLAETGKETVPKREIEPTMSRAGHCKEAESSIVSMEAPQAPKQQMRWTTLSPNLTIILSLIMWIAPSFA